jgi:hypothetical protein
LFILVLQPNIAPAEESSSSDMPECDASLGKEDSSKTESENAGGCQKKSCSTKKRRQLVRLNVDMNDAFWQQRSHLLASIRQTRVR